MGGGADSMTILSVFLIAMCCLTLGGANSLAVAEPTVDPHVSDVLSGGHFEHSGQSGSLRVLVECGGYEHVQCRVWAQWLIHQPDGTSVLKAVPVAELNGSGWVIGRLERAPSLTGLKAVASVQHTHVMSATGQFELFLREPGIYLLRWIEEPSFAEIEEPEPAMP